MKARIRELHRGHEDIAARLLALEERLRKLEGGETAFIADGLPQADAEVPLLARASEPVQRIEQAVWELENTAFNQVISKYPKDILSARTHHLQLLQANRWYSRAVVGLILLTFLEVPAWCHADGGAGAPWKWESGTSRCTVPGNPMLSGVPYLPPGWALVFEFLIEMLVLRKFLLEYTLEVDHFMPLEVEYHTTRWTKLGCVFALGSIIDTGVFLVLRYPFRLTFLFRTGLIFLLPHVRHLFFNIFSPRVMAEFFSVAIFFIGTMVFFAFIGVTLFQNDSTVAYQEGGKVVHANKGFGSFGEATYTMFVGGVTGEFLDSFLPSSVAYHSTALLWMVYLLLTQVLLKNLVMDTLISQYIKGAEEEETVAMEVRATGLCTVFELLRSEDRTEPEVLAEDFAAFVGSLGRSPRWKALPKNLPALLHEQVGRITRENFCDVCLLLENQYKVTKWQSSLNLQDKPEYEAFCRWVCEPEELPDFDRFMNKVLLLNLAMVVLESTYDVMNWDEPAWMDYVEIVFAFAYLGEVCAKLAVKSFDEYWSFPANRFDFFTTWLLLATSLLPYLPIQAVEADLAHYANILRLLRLIRVVKQLKQFPSVQFMVFTISRIVSAAGNILSLMGTSIFFFCNFSVNLFGGVLYEGNPKLEGTEYAENHWFVLNFNDMFSALATWFVQILCEYVPAYAQALRHASRWGSLAWWIVVLFYITTAAIMYELLLAFTIDIYLAVKKEWYQEEEEKEKEEEQGGQSEKEKEKEKEEEEEEPKNKSKGTKGSDADAAPPAELQSRQSPTAASPKTPSLFFARVQDVLEEDGLCIHYRTKYDAVLQKEFDEAYEEAAEQADFSSSGCCSGAGAVCQAAWQLEDGIEGREVHQYPRDIVAARADHLHALRATKMYNKAMLGVVLLTLAEVPAWCHASAGHGGFWDWQAGSAWCAAPAGGELHLSGVWYLPPGVALILELAIEFVILWKFLLEFRLEKAHFAPIGVEYNSRRCIVLGCVFSLGSIADTAAFAFFRYPVRLTFLFRTGLLCLLPGVRRLSRRIFNRKMLGEFTFVAIFFVTTVLLFAWISYTIFRGLDDVAFVKAGAKATRANDGFETLRSTVYTMFLAGITEGFVDIFIPSATVYRASAVLWFAFLILTQVLLLNLVIDAFVSAYLLSSEHVGEVAAERRAKATLSAFATLAQRDGIESSGGCLSEATLLALLEELGRSPRARPVQRGAAEVIVRQLGGVTRERFGDICPLLQNTVWVTRRDSPLRASCPELWRAPRFARLRAAVWEPHEAPLLDDVMNWVLLLNLVLIVLEFLEGGGPSPLWMRLADRLFTAVYVLEVLLKLSVKSFAEYWSLPANQFDFFTTWLLFGAMVLKHLPITVLQNDLAHYANILRLLRLLRVVKKLKQYSSFQFMVGTITRMVDAAGDILSLLGVVLFLFTTFSVNFFGGVIYEGNSKLEGTDFAEKHWFVFNFNDCIMAFVTWFVQLLAEYSPELAEALSLTAAHGGLAWLIFPLFYLVGVAILFEVLKAFTIETFLALKEEAERLHAAEAGEAEESGEEEEDEEGAELLQAAVIEGIQQELGRRGERLHVRFAGNAAFQRKLKALYLKRGEAAAAE